ncbi:MAG: AAA family ATPase [Acidobacteria bacterium]|nr:MAG: AAA family ATPase [Acidobacteriota bacterium]
MEEKAQAFRELFNSIKQEIQKRIVGLDETIEQVIGALFLGGHVLLEGVPGLGKTLLVKSLAETLDLSFSRIQFTPDLMPADILGTNLIVETAPGQKTFQFQQGPIFAHILLADEINRATPKTQSALLEAMQERSVTIVGRHYTLDEPFFVLATQNPIEMEGTYPLPEAQMDRFVYKLLVPFPSEKDLISILDRTTIEETAKLKPVANGERIREFAQFVLQVPVAEKVMNFVARFVLLTHPTHTKAPSFIHQYVRFGSSPRGAQALILSSKIRALRDGRYNVSIEDVLAAALPSLRHRLILNIEGQAENISTDILISQLISEVTK